MVIALKDGRQNHYEGYRQLCPEHRSPGEPADGEPANKIGNEDTTPDQLWHSANAKNVAEQKEMKQLAVTGAVANRGLAINAPAIACVTMSMERAPLR